MTMLSVCVFGSEARRSCDKLSDRDMLICRDRAESPDDFAISFAKDGWTIQSMRYDDISRLADSGSLFVQHLKKEGRMLRDDASRLSSILTRSNIVRVDMQRVKQDMLFLQSLQCRESIWEKACLSDINFVFFRNAAINIGFLLNRPKFDYDHALENVRRFAALTDLEVKYLQRLRLERTYYRTRKVSHEGCDPHALRIIASKIALVAAPDDNSPLHINAYQRLRTIELSLLADRSVHELDALSTCQRDFDLWQVIRSPKPYPKIEAVLDLRIDR